MESLAAYGSDEENNTTSAEDRMLPSLQLPSTINPIKSAPTDVIIIHNANKTNSRLAAIDMNTNTLVINSKIDIVLAPIAGPQNPFQLNANTKGAQRVGLGTIESTSMEDWCFDEQYQTFQKSGYAMDVDNRGIVGDYDEYVKNSGDVASYTKKMTKEGEGKRRRDESTPPEELGESSEGPWANVDKGKDAYQEALEEFMKTHAEEIFDDNKSMKEKPVSLNDEAKEDNTESEMKRLKMHIVEPDEEDEMWEKKNERKQLFTLPPRPSRGAIANETKTTFHGPAGSERDYQGRPWTAPPAGVHARKIPVEDRHESFIPKKCIKKYTGHTKGVQQIEFIPLTGHLLLSASMDGKCKIWDVAGDRNVKRTYIGHSEAVRSINFNSTGSQFVSSGYDRYMRVWDVETGASIGTYSNRKMGYEVRFSPTDPNIFLMAASDNKIYQWDVREGGIVQEYNYHLQPCNTVTFFDDGRKFVSTSDDKKVLVWEFGIPVPITYIQEPDLHSLPSVTLHPSEIFFVGQSMDSTIVTYSCGEKVRQFKKKIFRGHNNAGYACKIDFSPNGKFMMSGDGVGKLWFWDWKSSKILRSFQAHENGPCIGSAWHPLSPSVVATCGWDGLIKLWD